MPTSCRMAARPVAAFKRVTMTVNGVSRNITVQFPSLQSNDKNDAVETDDDDDDEECIITDVVAAGPTVSSSESYQQLSELTDSHVDDLDNVEPIEIIPSGNQPVSNTIDLTVSPVKPSSKAEDDVIDSDTSDVACPVTTSPSGVVLIPISLSSKNTLRTAVQADTTFPWMAGFQSSFANGCQVNSAELDALSGFSSLLSSEAAALLPAASTQPLTEASPASVISSARTMTKKEAIAAGWFTDEERPDHMIATTVIQPTEAHYSTSALMDTLPLVNDFSLGPIVGNNFVSSAEIVSLESSNFVTDSSTDLAMSAGSYCADSGIPIKQQHDIEIDVADDTILSCKLEKLFDNDDDDFDRLMSEEEEPLTAVIEGMRNDISVHGALSKTKTKPAMKKKATEQSGVIKRGRGRPPKLKLANPSHQTVTKIYKAKRTGGQPLTAAQRHQLRDCGVWLPQIWLPTTSVKMCVAWRYLCCRNIIPQVTTSCGLCRGRPKSDSFIELDTAHKFRAGSRHCTSAVDTWREFSVDPTLLPQPEDTSTEESKESPSKKKSPSKSEPTSDSKHGSSSHDNKKYLLIRAEAGTFVIPVDSAVGCIVSENEIADVLCPQATSSSLCDREFSKDTLLAACSQQSTALKSPSPTSETNVQRKGRKKKIKARLHSTTNVSAAKPVSKRKHFVNSLVSNACRFGLQRELHALGLKDKSTQKNNRVKHK